MKELEKKLSELYFLPGDSDSRKRLNAEVASIENEIREIRRRTEIHTKDLKLVTRIGSLAVSSERYRVVIDCSNSNVSSAVA